MAAVGRRRAAQPPLTCTVGADLVELWDADDFDPGTTLRWPTVRVLRYRQHKPNGTVIEACWLTGFPAARVSSPTLYRLRYLRRGTHRPRAAIEFVRLLRLSRAPARPPDTS